MKKIELKVKRTEGQIEIINVTEKFNAMTKGIFEQIKKSTAEAGRGEVLEAIITMTKSNILQLRKEYNNLHNEGGEGYIPEELSYWKTLPEFKEWEEVEVIK